MKAYEGLFLVDDGKATDNFGAVAEHVKGLLHRHEVKVEKLEKWDSRRLAYEIRGHKRGTYILTKFQADPSKIAALRRDCEISSIILRSMFLCEENVGEVLEGYDELDARPRRPAPAAAPAPALPAPKPEAGPDAPEADAAGGDADAGEPNAN